MSNDRLSGIVERDRHDQHAYCRSGITVGEDRATNGRVMLFWKGTNTGVNFGTTKSSVDFHSGEDQLMLHGGRETKVVGTNYLDFRGAGQDMLEIRSRTQNTGVRNIKAMVKCGVEDATVGAVTFSATEAVANVLPVSEGQ